MMFWDVFYKYCKEKGTSPNAVCREIGLSNAAATGWKSGTQPKADILVKIADHMGCSVDFLLGRSESPILVATWEEMYRAIDQMSDAQLDSLVRKIQSRLSDLQDQV